MNKDAIKIIKEIKSYENEDICLIVLSQKENKALLDYITNLDEKYKKSCETYQQALDETMSEKIDLEDKIKKAIEFIDKYCIDDEFYINLTYKEKAIIEVKKILKGEYEDE